MKEQFKKRKLFLNGGRIVTWEFHQYVVHVVVGFVYAFKHSLRAETNSLVSRHFVYVTGPMGNCVITIVQMKPIVKNYDSLKQHFNLKYKE